MPKTLEFFVCSSLFFLAAFVIMNINDNIVIWLPTAIIGAGFYLLGMVGIVVRIYELVKQIRENR